MRESERKLKQFSRGILAAREEEKKKLAQELHDEVGAMVVALGASLCVAEQGVPDNDKKAALKSLADTREQLKAAARNLKSVAAGLRPPQLDAVGIMGALKDHFSAFARQAGIGGSCR